MLPSDDQLRLQAWNAVLELLKHYRELAFVPMYRTSESGYVSKDQIELRKRKMALIAACEQHIRLRFDLCLDPAPAATAAGGS